MYILLYNHKYITCIHEHSQCLTRVFEIIISEFINALLLIIFATNLTKGRKLRNEYMYM